MYQSVISAVNSYMKCRDIKINQIFLTLYANYTDYYKSTKGSKDMFKIECETDTFSFTYIVKSFFNTTLIIPYVSTS